MTIYNQIFPNTGIADWFYALLGLILHAVVKLKTGPLKQFKWSIFLEDFVAVWIISVITITICLGTLPSVFTDYNLLDSALIGYSSSSIFRTLLKQKLSKLGIPEDENSK